MTSVTDAVVKRRSCRSFTDKPVDDAILKSILETALRSPSGGNLQPWHLYVLTGDKLADLKAQMPNVAQSNPMGEEGAYDIYPKGLKDPYRSRRFKVGEDLYGALGIAREDKFSRLMWLANNFQFFGAPVGLFCFVDRDMGPPQWSDLGMILQTIMLLAAEAGLETCAQEAWSMYHRTIQETVGAPEGQMLFCGMAIGYGDEKAPANGFSAERAPLDEVITFQS